MLIALDIDDVLAKWRVDFGRWLESIGEKGFSLSDCQTASLVDTLGLAEPVVAALIDRFFGEQAPLSTTDGAVDGLHQLRRDGHGLVIVSARPERHRRATEQWLACQLPELIGEVVLTDGPKSVACRALGASVLVEDTLVHAREVARTGIPVLLFDAGYPYNQAARLDPRIVRVDGWLGVCRSLAEVIHS